ncbi:MAG: flagellar assembly protein FliW [Acidobacteria bacterium]|nr:flagellar assembly protein FliW [Acidobacteriota bacterium]
MHDPIESIETRFGSFEGNSRDVVTLVEGLPGFEECRRFLLLSSPSLEPLVCLQGLDDAKPAFLAIDPRLVDPEYRCQLDDLQRRRLGASSDSALLWLAIVRVAEQGDATVNLRAPLVVNPERMRALQLLAGHDQYDTNHRLG